MPTLNWTEHIHSLIENRLEEVIPKAQNALLAPIFQAAHYSLLGKGKRLRPLLTLSVLADLNQPVELGLDPACALEILHTYSLIHDDLPCIDNASLRRGKPTLHTVYNEAYAVLTGDLLLTLAFEVISNAHTLSFETKVKLTSLLAKRSGGNGMIGGQLIDLTSEGQAISDNTLKTMYQNKTGALLATALEFGGLIGAVSVKKRSSLRELGFRFGVTFQMIDDLLDAHSNDAIAGKSTQSDQKNHKATALEVYGYDTTLKKIEAFFEESKELTQDWPQLGTLIEQYKTRIPRT